MGSCKICGQPHSSCGPSTTVVPVDQRIETKGQPNVHLKRYIVSVQSGRTTVDTILKLPPEEAERLGATEYVKGEESQAATTTEAAPARARTTTTPGARTARRKAATATAKPRTPRNKAAKKPANKTSAPAETPPPTAGGVEDATDPEASE